MTKDYLKLKPPYVSSVNLTDMEYREFVSAFGFMLNKLKKWLNHDILKDGIQFPYTVDEIDMLLKFYPGVMNIHMQVKEKSSDFFENEFWDEEYKKHGDDKDEGDTGGIDETETIGDEPGKAVAAATYIGCYKDSEKRDLRFTLGWDIDPETCF